MTYRKTRSNGIPNVLTGFMSRVQVTTASGNIRHWFDWLKAGVEPHVLLGVESPEISIFSAWVLSTLNQHLIPNPSLGPRIAPTHRAAVYDRPDSDLSTSLVSLPALLFVDMDLECGVCHGAFITSFACLDPPVVGCKSRLLVKWHKI